MWSYDDHLVISEATPIARHIIETRVNIRSDVMSATFRYTSTVTASISDDKIKKTVIIFLKEMTDLKDGRKRVLSCDVDPLN